MCQQWFSVFGLVADVIGFLMIAIEWHHMFTRDVYMRQKRIERDYNKSAAETEGKPFDDDADMEYTMWREFQKLLKKDTLYRQWLFYVGTGLIILGFVLQTAGSWPRGISPLSIKGC
jgi:hypothetical protein